VLRVLRNRRILTVKAREWR